MTEAVVAQEKGIWTGAGESAGFDLGLRLIESFYGDDLTPETVKWAVRSMPGHAGPRQPSSAGLRFRHLSPKLAQAIELMESNLEEPLDLARISSKVSISRRHLERNFVQHVGTTPHRFYVELRLQRAASLLRHTPMTLAEICLSCGFATVSHFSKTFRSAYCCSPTEFRKGSMPGFVARPASLHNRSDIGSSDAGGC